MITTKSLAKKTMLMVGGICWFLFAGTFGVLLAGYLVEGAGFQFFGLAVSSVSVLMGLVHVAGLFSACGLCLVVGVGLCAHGLVTRPTGEVEHEEESGQQK